MIRADTKLHEDFQGKDNLQNIENRQKRSDETQR